MKSRSEAKKAKDKQKAETEADHAVEREAIREEATTPAEKKAAAETGGKPNGLFCEKCLEPQVDTPSGATCANRHGGADGLTAKEAKAVRAQREKNAAEDAAKEEPETDDEEEEDDEDEPVWAAMWSEATKSLQSEKESGQRAKQITDADVKARVATLYPDQYRDQEDRRRAIEFTVKSLERLADIWFKKISNLETHVAKLRG